MAQQAQQEEHGVQQEEEEVPFVFEVGDSGVMAALNRAILNITGQPPSSTSHACLHMRGRPTSTLVVCITTAAYKPSSRPPFAYCDADD